MSDNFTEIVIIDQDDDVSSVSLEISETINVTDISQGILNVTSGGDADAVQDNLNIHIADKTNPHEVEADQIDNTIDFNLIFENQLI